MSSEYYLTKESVEEYIKLAEGVNGEEIINRLIPYLNSEDNVLEIGSGPGSDWEILSKNFKATGSDFSNEFLIRLKESYPNENFLKLDAISLETNLKFDCIYSNKVLHHLTNDELATSITKQYSLLNENGVICHSFWKGEGNESFKGMFVNYHKRDDLIAYFTPLFDILEIEEYKEFEESDSLILIGRKKQ